VPTAPKRVIPQQLGAKAEPTLLQSRDGVAKLQTEQCVAILVIFIIFSCRNRGRGIPPHSYPHRRDIYIYV